MSLLSCTQVTGNRTLATRAGKSARLFSIALLEQPGRSRSPRLGFIWKLRRPHWRQEFGVRLRQCRGFRVHRHGDGDRRPIRGHQEADHRVLPLVTTIRLAMISSATFTSAPS